jgi:hypothetical protein
MNCVMTRAFHPVRFQKGEPFAHIFPVNLAGIEQIKPEFKPYETEENLKDSYEEWQDSRNNFNNELEIPGSQARKDKWQKAYFQGLGPDAKPTEKARHWTKLDVQPWPGSKAKKK